MAISAPAPQSTGLQLPTSEFVVLLGDEDGNAPELEGERPDLYPIVVSRLASGRRDDLITLGFRDQDRIVDTKIPIGQKRQVEVRALDSEGEPTIILGWGTIMQKPMRIDEGQERTTIEARIVDAHFGFPAEHYWVLNRTYDPVRLVEVHRPIVFNPEVDGEIVGNFDVSSSDSGEVTAYNDALSVWIDHESIETDKAREWQKQPTLADEENNLWDVRTAIHSICWLLNPNQSYIKNPTLEDLSMMDLFENVDFRNVKVPWGKYLPDVLDAILIPLELGWYLHHSLNENDERETHFRFYRRRVGEEVEMQMQRPQEKRDTTKTNVTALDVTYSILGLANNIHVFGDMGKVQSTFKLLPGWSTEMDSKSAFDLRVGGPVYKKHPEVGRLYVFGEDGSYCGLRPEFGTVPRPLFGGVGAPIIDSDSLLNTQRPIPRRRRFLPCISQHGAEGDNVSDGYVVETYDKVTEKWVRVKWPFQVLEKQMGIIFTGDAVPDALWRCFVTGRPEDAKIRITASIALDRRLKDATGFDAASPSGLNQILSIDMHDKFQFSEVDLNSALPNPVPAGGVPGRIIDTVRIRDYATKVRTIEDAMHADCSLELEGCLHPELHIGDRVPVIAGRDITLKLNNPTADGDEQFYPQIVGFKYHCQQQRLEVMLESFRKERPVVISEHPEPTTDAWEKFRANATGNWRRPKKKRPGM